MVKTEVLVGNSMAQGMSVLKSEWKALLEGYSGLKMAEFLEDPLTSQWLQKSLSMSTCSTSVLLCLVVEEVDFSSMVRLIECFWLETLDKHDRYPGKIPWQKGSSRYKHGITVIENIVGPSHPVQGSQAEQREFRLQGKVGRITE